MSDLTHEMFASDDGILVTVIFHDWLRAASEGDHKRLAQLTEELGAWGISIEFAGCETRIAD